MTTKQRSIIYTGLPVGAALLLLLAFFFALPGGAVAAPEAPNALLWAEDFDYGSTAGDLTAVSGGNWTNHSGTTPYIQYVTASLSLPGYGSSGVGGAATFSTSGSEDVNRTFAEQSSGTVYAASLVNISSASSGGGYFIHLMRASTTSFTARVFARDSSGALQFGFDNTSTAVWATTNFSYNTTYLVVLKFDPATGDSALYVLDAYSATEPATPLLTDTGTGLVVSAFAIRQSSGIPTGVIDGIRIATSWEEAVGATITTPDLTIAKTGPSVVLAGEDMVYEIIVSNTNIQTATNVVVTDTLPLSTTLVAASGGFTQTNPATGLYVWELGEIISDTQVTFNVTVTVDINVSDSTVLTNTAEVSTDAAGDDPTNNLVEHYATVAPLVSIHDIQYVADPGTDDASPYVGQTVFVEGIVTAAPGEFSSSVIVIEEPGGGAWSGLYVYKSGGFGSLSAPRGTEVRILGEVSEYNGLTEFMADTVTVLSSGNPVPGPDMIDTGDYIAAATAEQWESVLVECQNATVTQLLTYGEWKFTDGSGETVGNDTGSITYSPTIGDYYDSIRGIGLYSFGAYKVEPRDDADITLAIPPQDLGVTKGGPTVAFAGEEIAYTLQVQNPLLVSLSDVVLTDTLPVSLTNVISASNALTVTNLGDQIVWEFGDLGAGITETVYLTATVPLTMPFGFALTNNAVVTSTTPGDDPANNTAVVNTSVYQLVPIATARAGSNGEIFAVEGKVIVEPGTYGNNEWELQDDSGGIAAYFSPRPTFDLGDTVRLVGARGSYNGQEQFTSAIYLENLGSGPEVSPLITDTGEVAAGNTEGWLVQVEGEISNLTCPSGGSFNVDDGTGAAYIYIDYDTGIRVCDLSAENGDFVRVVGFSTEYTPSGADPGYQIKPRRPTDVALLKAAPAIAKEAAPTVEVGGLLTYTLTIENKTGQTLSGLTIVDSVPTTTTLVSVLDGGIDLGGTTVTWDVASLLDQASVSVRFVVEALDDPGATIVNDLYYFQASNWVTQTFGAPVWTFIGEYIPIPMIQGDDFRSPYEGMAVTTRGEVIGFFEGNSSVYGNFDGFFIQDPLGDGDETTSDAIFINHKSLAITVNIGDLVEVTGMVDEFDEYDGAACYGAECLTQVSVSSAGDVTVLPSALAPHAITPVELDPPGDSSASDVYFEALESMLVTLPNTSTVVGPTSYGAVHVVSSDLGIDRVMRTGPYEGMPVAVRNWELYGEINSADAPNLITGSTIVNADGPLGFSYGDYMIITQDSDEWAVDNSVDPPVSVPSWPMAAATQFSVATFNTYNFDSGASAAKQTKVINTIAEFNGAAFVALEEIEGDNETFMAGLLADLATAGYNYDYVASHTDVGGHGVALLWNTDLVSNVSWSTEYQDCSPYGSSSSTYDPLWATCQALGEYPLFSRRPVVVTGTLSLASGDLEVVAIANHFKSKLGGIPADMRRLEQGVFVNELAADFVASGSPNVIVMGDLNDFEDAPALVALTANGTLVNAWDTFAGDEPYSYIYEGVSQILDHILVSEALYDWLADMGALHIDADFPYNPYTTDDSVIWRTSDHDPVAATIQVPYRLFMPLIFGAGD